MANIVHRVGIKAPAVKVHAALTSIKGLTGWWTNEVSGNPQEGGKIEFIFKSPTGKEMARMLMKVKHVSEKDVHWQVEEGPSEWIGTDITFELSHADGMTILNFGHRNWDKEIEFMGHCSTKWAVVLLSLRDLVELGKGKPSPHDIKIDNWN